MPDKEPNDDVCLLLDPATDLARAAGEKILEIYNSDFTVQEKDDQSPLTAADMASHHAILDGLAGLTPEIPVLSEESAKPAVFRAICMAALLAG